MRREKTPRFSDCDERGRRDTEGAVLLRTEWNLPESEARTTGAYVIYGAGVVAYNVYVALKLLWNLSPICFAVTDKQEAGNKIEETPVLPWGEVSGKLDSDVPVIVATPEVYHKAIQTTLVQSGYEHIFCVNAHREYELMSRYFKEKGNLLLLSDMPHDIRQTDRNAAGFFSVYMAKSHKDKVLTGEYEIPEWVTPVQAGRACTDVQIAEVTDCEGEQISLKNPNYCELTVTYWAWRNCRNKYKGICHYRRMLLLDETQLNQCLQNDVDVILPLPFVCYPTAKGQYGRYIGQKDQDALRRALSETAPEYLAAWEWLDEQPLFYNYNMLIAKEHIFDQYSRWLFKVLEQAEKYCDPEQKRADRYAGYLGELLTSLYVMKHRDEWKIAHAEKNWMV